MGKRCTKRRWDTELDAKIALMNATRPTRRHRPKEEKRFYRCPACRKWHLTSMERRDD